ncbi:G patch domain-containing protein 8 isoform X2 [Morus notabilis]|uniref:G patch domain-containing protein 8 isoform X2 n=1 Tax=Morus notabilis TaxID=981085 RepID=UPI000CED5CF5|nr:G patch domain-containing protein 8 isoform X2 [Morus notabilis]
MRKRDSSDSDSSEAHESSSSEEDGTSGGRKTQVEKGVSEYEKQRLSRIAAIKARMEAMGLPQMASSLMGSAQNSTKKMNKGKAKGKDDDDDYRPEEEGPTSFSEEEEEEKDDHDDDYLGGKASGSGKRKSASKKVRNTVPKSKKKVAVRKMSTTPDYIDDDDALKMAIALSLQDKDGGTSGSSDRVSANVNETKGKMQTKEDAWNKKRKKSFASRLQMTEDELILHFYQFDENWNDGISVRDLERVAKAHDFTWTDEELYDMIRCFDSDGDGKLSLDDFRKIAVRCRMIKGCEEP